MLREGYWLLVESCSRKFQISSPRALLLRDPLRPGIASFEKRPIKPAEEAIGRAHENIRIAVAVPVGHGNRGAIGRGWHVERLARREAIAAYVAKQRHRPAGSAADHVNLAVAVPVNGGRDRA